MTRYRFTVKIAAPPSAVYDLWTDLDRTHEWVEGVTKLTDVTGRNGDAGTTYTLWFGPTRSRCEIIEAERPWRIRTKFHSIQAIHPRHGCKAPPPGCKHRGDPTTQRVDTGSRCLLAARRGGTVGGEAPRAAAPPLRTGPLNPESEHACATDAPRHASQLRAPQPGSGAARDPTAAEAACWARLGHCGESAAHRTATANPLPAGFRSTMKAPNGVARPDC